MIGTWQSQIRLVVVGAATAFAFAIWGYASYLGDASWSDVLFYALNLMALNFHQEVGRTVPLPLEIARFLVHIVAAAAIGFTVYGVARRQFDRQRAVRMSDHVVVLGETERARMLAVNYRSAGSKVVLVGEVDQVHQEALRRRRITVVDGAGGHLEEITGDAYRIIAAGDSDNATARWFTALSDRSNATRSRLHLVVEEPGLAIELRRRIGGAALHDVDVCCVSERVASTVLRRFPPREPGIAAPPPVVIGEAPLAEELVRQMLRGWYQPGWPLEVLAITRSEGEFQHAVDDLSAVGTVVPRATANLVQGAPRIVAEHARARRPSAGDREGCREQGPLVFIAGLDDVAAVTLASKLLDCCDQAQVVALVDRPDAWTQLAPHDDQEAPGQSLHLERAGAMVTDPSVLEYTGIERLADELLAEHGDPRIPPPVPFGVASRIDIRPDTIPESTRATFEQLARASLYAVLAAGLQVRRRPALPLILQPTELLEIATQLREEATNTAGLDRSTIEDWLEVAARLPASLVRVGMDLGRGVMPEVEFDATVIEQLARLAHDEYVRERYRSGSATGSEIATQRWEELSDMARESNRAQVRDLPVKLAAAGRDVVPFDGREPEDDWLTGETLERLAELEHRRWMHVHLRAGYRVGPRTDHAKRVHAMLRPWDELSDDVKQYDRDVVLGIPARLAAVGIGTCAMPGGAAQPASRVR